MPDESSGFLGRIFGKAPKEAAVSSSEPHALVVSKTTVGLCFDFARGAGFESTELSDTGLKHVLGVLRDRKLTSTFFCPAKLCDTAPQCLDWIAREGHEIGCLGYWDEKPSELTPEALVQMILSCRAAFDRRGLRPIGYRYPHSEWDERLCKLLHQQRFRYNAHHDHAKHPYVLSPGEPPLVRVPIYTDDRGLRRREDTYNEVISKHHRTLRKAIARGNFVSICFHPWILVEAMERMNHWEEWVDGAVKSGAAVGAIGRVLGFGAM
jgi:peptidoglycan/xylan/chitin deacetylase (PgdA/CDA1 family)